MTEKNQNGKGSKWRKTSFKKYWSGYDEIDWSNKKDSNKLELICKKWKNNEQ